MTNSELEIILQEGENYKIEFKESIDKSFIEEVVAFSNASGGKIFIGVNDKGIIKGMDTSNTVRSSIQNTMRQIQPDLAVKIDIFDEIIIITVPEGHEKPYSCSRGFFLRVGPNAQKLNRNEIIAFLQSEGRIRFDELIKSEAVFEDCFDQKIYNKFIELSGISEVLDKEPILQNLSCLVKSDNKNVFTNGGILFFAKEPTTYIPHAYIICALYKGTEKVTVLDRKDFFGDIISNIEDTILFLKKHLNLSYEITSLRRKEILEIPEVALREAVVNAICHRDYFEKGAQVMVEIFDDRVEISNPGGLPKGLKEEDFGKRSLARNPIIASLLHRANYIEKMGTGINRIRLALKEVGTQEPEFKYGDFFTILFRRNIAKNFGINFGINDTQKKIIELILKNPTISAKEIADSIGLKARSIELSVSDLKKKGILIRKGSRKKGYWEINQ